MTRVKERQQRGVVSRQAEECATHDYYSGHIDPQEYAKIVLNSKEFDRDRTRVVNRANRLTEKLISKGIITQ